MALSMRLDALAESDGTATARRGAAAFAATRRAAAFGAAFGAACADFFAVFVAAAFLVVLPAIAFTSFRGNVMRIPKSVYSGFSTILP
jgi:hypothetical protein